jgi:hypothetical protein
MKSDKRQHSRPLLSPFARWSGRLTLFVITLGLISGCATVPGKSKYTVSMPTLSAHPREVPCKLNDEAITCLVVVEEDWNAIVRELKAACIANGQTPKECFAQ